jgi:hypothetical protein
MILRRVTPEAMPLAEVAKRIKNFTEVSILQENAPSTLLVEGPPDLIENVVRPLAGWRAMPIVRFDAPDPRPRVLKPASE